jgi:hypothetical protein
MTVVRGGCLSKVWFTWGIVTFICWTTDTAQATQGRRCTDWWARQQYTQQETLNGNRDVVVSSLHASEEDRRAYNLWRLRRELFATIRAAAQTRNDGHVTVDLIVSVESGVIYWIGSEEEPALAPSIRAMIHAGQLTHVRVRLREYPFYQIERVILPRYPAALSASYRRLHDWLYVDVDEFLNKQLRDEDNG